MNKVNPLCLDEKRLEQYHTYLKLKREFNEIYDYTYNNGKKASDRLECILSKWINRDISNLIIED